MLTAKVPLALAREELDETGYYGVLALLAEMSIVGRGGADVVCAGTQLACALKLDEGCSDEECND